MIQRLSSITLTFYNLVVLILLMGVGVLLSLSHKEIFTQMNEVNIFNWITATWESAPLLVVWFLVLCLSAGVLFINALCCSLDRQLVLAKKTGQLKNWLFFILHFLFLMTLACHGLILVVGEKQSRVLLFPGQVETFGPYEIQLDDLVFSDDTNILRVPKKEQRALMTRKSIHIHENYARLSLLKNNRPLASKKVMMLSPLQYRSVQITLIEFVIQGADNRLGVILTFTNNFLNRFFFWVYGVMILALAGFTAVTWKRPLVKKGDKI